MMCACFSCGGDRYFLTQKLSWNELNRIPHNTFSWVGLDGSDVIAHFPPADNYNCEGKVAEVLKCEQNQADRHLSPRSLMLFGIGDGGGGPTRAHLERMQRITDVRGLPRVSQRSPVEFFAAVEQDAQASAESSAAGYADGATPSFSASAASVATSAGASSAAAALPYVSPQPAPLPPAIGGGLPKWVGELYFERHRGKHLALSEQQRMLDCL